MITVMTPTYNRAYILPKAYASLKKQTSHEFEWIIVDDGSTDATEELVNGWVKEENAFKITYIKQQNGGKHRAVNRGVQAAAYDWFFILDSDDTLTENAIKTVHVWISGVAGLRRLAGVAGLKGDDCFKAVGGRPKLEYIDATNLERQRYGLLGDKAEIYKTEILKKYPFPEFEGENFIRESAVWDRIAADGLQIRWYNEIIYLCDYIDDGLTKNTSFTTYAKNFKGYTYCSALYIATHSPLLSLHKCGEFYQVAKSKGLNRRQSAQALKVNIIFLCVGILGFKLKPAIKTLLSIFGRKCR